MAAPDLDFADFAKGGLNYAIEPDGRVMSLPLNLDPWVVYYNKELFAAKGIAYPKTFAEMLDAAAKLNDPAKGVSRLRRRAASRMPTCRCGRASCSATAGRSSTPRAS